MKRHILKLISWVLGSSFDMGWRGMVHLAPGRYSWLKLKRYSLHKGTRVKNCIRSSWSYGGWASPSFFTQLLCKGKVSQDFNCINNKKKIKKKQKDGPLRIFHRDCLTKTKAYLLYVLYIIWKLFLSGFCCKSLFLFLLLGYSTKFI